jgi:HNH endonuclease
MPESDSGEPTLLAAVMGEQFIGGEGMRWTVTRTGDRPPIPASTRFLVHCRDNWRCLWCDFIADPTRKAETGQHLEVDHIMPWSAHGSDRSDNLRSLCNRCNTDRSNFFTDGYAKAKACTVWCDPCAELLDRIGIDIGRYSDVEPWLLRRHIPSRWKVLQEVDEFDIAAPPAPVFVFCFYGNHQSWMATDHRVA